MAQRVLVIDDDRLVRETYQDVLEEEGFEVTLAATAEEGLRLARQGLPPHVVLLDQRLEGPGGGDVGLDLITPLVEATPSSRVLVVTGFANEHAIAHAFGRGAWDYLVKDRVVLPLLRHKVRQAADAAEAAMAARPLSEIEAELAQTWASARTETDSHLKGRQLERTLQLLFQTLPGLAEARRDLRPVGEQLDVVVRNESDDPFLHRQGDLFLVECKNWSASAGVPDVRSLIGKMQSKHRRCRLGLFISLNGFAGTVRGDLLQHRQNEWLMVLIDGVQLNAWIHADDRLAWLKTAVQGAALR